MTDERAHKRHAVAYIDRAGTQAIVTPQHYNGIGGVLLEDEQPTLVEGLQDSAHLATVLQGALDRSSVRDELNLRDRHRAGWPCFKASHLKSVREFEATFITVSFAGANEFNLIYTIEGMPEPDAAIWVTSSASARSSELGDKCLLVWRACRDRSF